MFMKKNNAVYLNFIAAILFAITSIMYFIVKINKLGICYACLTIIYILLGFKLKNGDK